MSTHQVAQREAAELTFMLRQSNISIFFDMKYLFLIRQCLKQFQVPWVSSLQLKNYQNILRRTKFHHLHQVGCFQLRGPGVFYHVLKFFLSMGKFWRIITVHSPCFAPKSYWISLEKNNRMFYCRMTSKFWKSISK